MTLSTDEWIKWVDTRVESIIARPAMWGGRQAVELQLLQLAEVRQLAVDSSALTADPCMLVKKWIKHSKKHNNRTLQIAECSEEEFQTFLRSMVNDLNA